MPWLFIDTHAPERFRIARMDVRAWKVWTSQTRGGLLRAISQRIGLRELRRFDGICVVRGPGGFSCTRSGVLVANVLSRILHLPLVGVTVDESADLAILFQRVHTGAIGSVAFVEPIYAMEPNITLPKKHPGTN